MQFNIESSMKLVDFDPNKVCLNYIASDVGFQIWQQINMSPDFYLETSFHKNCNFQQYSLVSNLIALVPDKHLCWAPIFIVWPARTPEPLTLGPFMMNYTILVAISLLFIIICLVLGFFLNYTNLYPIFITPRVGVMNFTINDPTLLEMLYTE